MPVTLGSSCASTTILWSGPTSWNTVSTSPIGSADASDANGKSRSMTILFMGETPADVRRHSCLLSCTPRTLRARGHVVRAPLATPSERRRVLDVQHDVVEKLQLVGDTCAIDIQHERLAERHADQRVQRQRRIAAE